MVLVKIPHMETSAFTEWLEWAELECVRNGGEPFHSIRYRGATADYWELTGNSGILCYVKTKWG